jgi:hypothetical protein
MSVRFQRRVKLFLGCHLNLSGSGVGVSFGGRGAHVGISSRWPPFRKRPFNTAIGNYSQESDLVACVLG